MIRYITIQALELEQCMDLVQVQVGKGFRLLGPIQIASHRKQLGYLATLYRDTEGEEG